MDELFLITLTLTFFGGLLPFHPCQMWQKSKSKLSRHEMGNYLPPEVFCVPFVTMRQWLSFSINAYFYNKKLSINYIGVGAKLFELLSTSSACTSSQLTPPLPWTSSGNVSWANEVIPGSPQLSVLSASKKLLPSVATGVGSSLWYEDRLATDKNYHSLEGWIYMMAKDMKNIKSLSVSLKSMWSF